MKTKLFLAALIVLVGTSAFASGPGIPRLVVIGQKNPGIFKVIYESGITSNVKMTILDKNEAVVFAETTKNVEGFIRSVNFTRMEPGEYTIEIADKAGKQIQKVVYAAERETVTAPAKNVRVAKIAADGKYLLTVTNSGINQVKVRIYDGANNLVHNESTTVNGDFGLVYNLKDVAGVPTFEVTDKTGSVSTIKY